MTPTLTAHVRPGHSCWTDEYRLRHCEGYRVRGPEGIVGYVEEVRLSPEEDAVETLLVRGRHYEKIEVPAELIEGVDGEADCLWISELERGDPERGDRRAAPRSLGPD